MPTLSHAYIFPAPTSAGEELGTLAQELCNTVGLETEIIQNGTQQMLASACMTNQVVIFDATRGDNIHNNYSFAIDLVKLFQNCLVVSRDYLPVNFEPERVGGAPNRPTSGPQAEIEGPDENWSNDRLVTWLATQLQDIREHTSDLKKINVFRYFPELNRAIEAGRARRKLQGQIFLSYRTRYQDEVAELATQIRRGDFHGGTPKTVRFIRKNELSYSDELLTEMTRLMFHVVVHYYIIECEELWIYNTDDYLNSWWTQGELVHWAWTDPQPKVISARRQSGRYEIQDVPPNSLPRLDTSHKKLLARLEVNSNPKTMGPESVAAIAELAGLPFLENSKYLTHRVFSEAFNRFPTLQCPECTEKLATNRKRSTNDFRVDVDRFIQGEIAGLVPYSQALSNGKTIACSTCKSLFEIREAKPRYLWYATRGGKITGPDGTSLARLPCFRAILKKRGDE